MEGAKDFNPRSREGSDNIPKLIYNCSSISIHAPARGATCGQNQPIAFFVISIHAPARGATAETQEILTFDIISIHAPARGATSFRDVTKPTSQNFNPRSREGSDAFSMLQLLQRVTFQSTLPRGERRCSQLQ